MLADSDVGFDGSSSGADLNLLRKESNLGSVLQFHYSYDYFLHLVKKYQTEYIYSGIDNINVPNTAKTNMHSCTLLGTVWDIIAYPITQTIDFDSVKADTGPAGALGTLRAIE